MVRIKKSVRPGAGWRMIAGGSAFIYCPVCRGRFSLIGHDITDEGVVAGLVICPYKLEGNCSFEAELQLLDWEALQVPQTASLVRKEIDFL